MLILNVQVDTCELAAENRQLHWRNALLALPLRGDQR